jgi:hypothetical protein
MNLEEWRPLAARMDLWWGQPAMTEEREVAYFELLRVYEAADVIQAVTELATAGADFTPSVSVIVAKIEEDVMDDRLRWPRPWNAVRYALARGSDARQVEQILQTEHALYIQFVREQGVERLRTINEEDPQAMKNIEIAWRELLRSHRRGEIAHRARELAAGPMKSLAPSVVKGELN